MKLGEKPDADSTAEVKEDVEHEREAAAVAIGEKSEQKRADGASGEAGRDGERDFRDGAMEIACDGSQDEREDEKIESVERPTEKTGDQSIASGWHGRTRWA